MANVIMKSIDVFLDLDETMTDKFFMVEESKYRLMYDSIYEIVTKSFEAKVDTMFKDVYDKYIDDDFTLAMYLLGGIFMRKVADL